MAHADDWNWETLIGGILEMHRTISQEQRELIGRAMTAFDDLLLPPKAKVVERVNWQEEGF